MEEIETNGTNARQTGTCALSARCSFRAKMDWNDCKDCARTPDGTKDIKEFSDSCKGPTMDFSQ